MDGDKVNIMTAEGHDFTTTSMVQDSTFCPPKSWQLSSGNIFSLFPAKQLGMYNRSFSWRLMLLQSNA
jgi:hypothetical protein